MRYLEWWFLGGMLAVATATRLTAAPQDLPQTQPAPTQPAATASATTPFDPQRFNDLITLIEGQNSPQARRTGARELLRHGWDETLPRLTAILRGPNRAAKVAVALAVSDLPEYFVPEFTEPLLAMLADGDADVRQAAGAALATGRRDDIIPRLKTLLLNPETPLVARLAAIDALGLMTQREAVAALVEVLGQRDTPLATPALAALERATAQDFEGDFDAAIAWWDTAREATPTDWQRIQIERLVHQNRATALRLREFELRLAGALRDNYVRTPEAERPTLLNAYLTDPSAAVRRLGLALAQSQLAERKTLTPENVAHTRELLTAPEPDVRAAAVRTIATLRDPEDAVRFERMLAAEHHRAVREALVNGLGYVGSGSAAPALLAVLDSTDQAVASEAVTALGRLAERGVLDDVGRVQVATALLAFNETVPRDEHAIRERLLWAMSRVGDPRFGAPFVAALDSPEAAMVRLAAVRGIAVMANPQTIKANGQSSQPSTAGDSTANSRLRPRELVDALVTVTNDPDAGVRRAAVETLAQFATNDNHIEALWGRLSPDREPEESIRVSAWRGALRILAGRPLSEIQGWLQRFPADEADRNQHAVELLQAAEKNLAANPEARGELGLVRADLAACRASLGQIDQSIATYQAALEDLHAIQSPQIARVAVELLRLALIHDRYDSRIADLLAGANAPLDGAALWEGIRDEIERRMQPDQVGSAIAMLVAVQTNPPTSMPADTQNMLEEMLRRARQVQTKGDATLVNSALQTLQQTPDDQPARQAITELGDRAVPALRDALRAALQSEQPDANRIQQLHDLLKTVVPDWIGFAPDAPGEDKLRSLEPLGA